MNISILLRSKQGFEISTFEKDSISFRSGEVSYENGDYEKGYQCLQQLSRQGIRKDLIDFWHITEERNPTLPRSHMKRH